MLHEKERNCTPRKQSYTAQNMAVCALDGHTVAFGPSTAGSREMVDCGYCGKEFPNLPQPDWNARKYHLDSVHVFGRCDETKKFYRADHFKQHIVHSHAAQNGIWTKRLQEASFTQKFDLVLAGKV